MRLVARTVLALLAIATCGVLTSTPAAAATATVPRPPSGAYSCADGTTVTVATNGSPWRPVRLDPSGTKLTPTAYTQVLVPEAGDPISVSVVRSPGGTFVCTATAPQLGEDGTSVIGQFTWTVTGTLGR